MVARAYGDALAIERLTDITGAEPLEHEQQDAGLFRRGADEAPEGHVRRPLHLIPAWAYARQRSRRQSIAHDGGGRLRRRHRVPLQAQHARAEARRYREAHPNVVRFDAHVMTGWDKNSAESLACPQKECCDAIELVPIKTPALFLSPWALCLIRCGARPRFLL